MGPGINVDVYNQSKTILKKINERDNSFSDAHYNLARLSDERNRKTTAARHWRSFLKQEPFGSYAMTAQKELGRAQKKSSKKTISYRSKSFKPRIEPGDISKSKNTSLKKMKRHKVELGTLSGSYYHTGKELVVVLEDIVEFYEKETKTAYSKVKPILSGLRPKRIFNSVSGVKTIVYDNFAIDIKDGIIIKKIWFEKLAL